VHGKIWRKREIRANYNQVKWMPPPADHANLAQRIRNAIKTGVTSIEYVYAYLAYTLPRDSAQISPFVRRKDEKLDAYAKHYDIASGWIPTLCLVSKAKSKFRKARHCAKHCLNKFNTENGKSRFEEQFLKNPQAIGYLFRTPEKISRNGNAPTYQPPLVGFKNANEFRAFGMCSLAPVSASSPNGGGGVRHYYPRSADKTPRGKHGYINLAYNVGRQGGISVDTIPVHQSVSFYVCVDGTSIQSRTARRPGAELQPSIPGAHYADMRIFVRPLKTSTKTALERSVWRRNRGREYYVYGCILYQEDSASQSLVPRFGWVAERALDLANPQPFPLSTVKKART
jgi:hypothetical protein